MKLKSLVDVLSSLVKKNEEETKVSDDLQARIIIGSLSYSDSYIMINENGERCDPPVPDPVEEEFIVKAGDTVSGFDVLAVTAEYIELKSYMEYTIDNESTPKTQFTVKKGECINLNMYGVCDAVHKKSINYIGIIDLSQEDRSDRRDDYIATKDDWEISPMPDKNARFIIKRKFSDEQIIRLKKGHIPEEMEDRWFFYYEDGKAYFHRSWSGSCIYIVEFNFKSNKHTVIVNRDDNQYSNTDLDEDIEQINYLLNV